MKREFITAVGCSTPIGYLARLTVFFLLCLTLANSALIRHSTAQESSPDPTRGETERATTDDRLNEQTIYIPYDKLKEVFERDGRGVFLPYDKFKKLWEEARKRQPKSTTTPAPFGAVITDIASTASLGDEIVNVEAQIQIELIRKGWHRLPLRLGDAAIRSARIGDKEARVVLGPNGGYELVVEHRGDESRTIQLDLNYAKALTKSGAQSTVSFKAPQSPVNRWIILTGEKGVDVEIEPMIATSQVNAMQNETEDQGSGEGSSESDGEPGSSGDRILAFVGAAPNVVIRWTPKAEGASGLTALVSAETEQGVQIDQGVTRTSAKVVLSISRAEVTTVKLAIPKGQKVVNIFDRNVKKWDVKEEDGEQIATIELFEPKLGQQILAVELERFVEDVSAQDIVPPLVRVIDASRNQGIVLVKLAAGLRSEVTSKVGLMQIDRTELPKHLTSLNWNFVFRYAALPVNFSLAVKKIEPLINVDQLVQFSIEPGRLKAELDLQYDIQQAGVFRFLLNIPKEYELRDVRPSSRKNVTGAAIDTFYKDESKEDQWIVTLSRKGMGAIGMTVVLEREVQDENLLRPTGETSQLDLPVPAAALEGIEFAKGHVIVYAPESLQVNAKETMGLGNEEFRNAIGQRSALNRQKRSLRPVLTYGFSNTSASLTLDAKRRKPQVTAVQLLVVTVDSGVVKYDARFFYDVRYSGVKALRLDVPTDLVDDLRNQTNSVQHQAMTPQPDDVKDGYTAWELTGDKEFIGKHQIRFNWEAKTEELPLGQSMNIPVDRIIPMEVDRASGQVVTKKSESIDVRPQEGAEGLRPIDPQTDLTSGVSMPDAAMAFEFVDDWSLGLLATRYELESLKRTSISRALIRAVALRQNELSVQALYSIRSVEQRLAIQMPEGFDPAISFDDQPVRVNGNRVTPERGSNGLIYVPLTGQSADASFLLEVRYSIPGSHRQVDIPVFPENPAVQKVNLCVYLPNESALIHKSGNWTDTFVDIGDRTLGSMFRRRVSSVDQVMNWVKEETGVRTISKFETDGRPYIFTALRPEAPPNGSLHLGTINTTLLNVLVCLVIGSIGLVALPRNLVTKLALMLLIAAALVFIGVFFPLITEHLFGEALQATVGITIVTWLIFDAIRWIRRHTANRHAMREQLDSQEAAGWTNDEAIERRNENAAPESADAATEEVPDFQAPGGDAAGEGAGHE